MKKSDIKIDNNFTTVANVPLCKQAAANFCARFTDADIVSALVKAAWECGTPEYIESNADIIYISADIYCSAPICVSEKDVMLCIRAFLFTYSSVFKMTVYCDTDFACKNDLTMVERFVKSKRD